VLRVLVCLLSLLLAPSVMANMDAVRALYLQAIDSKAGAEALEAALQGPEVANSPLLQGYLGTAKTLQAQHAFNPYTKYQLFCEGRNLLEAAIASSPDNAELRYLRFTIQENAPGFLGYNSNLQADKAAIFDFLAKADGNTGIFVMMRATMLASDVCTNAEKDALSAALPTTHNAGKY